MNAYVMFRKVWLEATFLVIVIVVVIAIGFLDHDYDCDLLAPLNQEIGKEGVC